MEGFGVLRACAQLGLPAVEVRAISNEIAEGDRSRWRIGRALDALADTLPRVLEAAAEQLRAHGAAEEARRAAPPPPLPPAQRTVGQLVGEAIRAYGARFWSSLVLGVPSSLPTRSCGGVRPDSGGAAAGDGGLVSASYVLAVGLVNDVPVRSRRGLRAYVVAVLLFSLSRSSWRCSSCPA